jgi:hypothetical protein
MYYEDSILNIIYDKINHLDIKGKFLNIITAFNTIWKDYQSNWSDSIWDKYNKLRKTSKINFEFSKSYMSIQSNTSAKVI